jgi:solute carrier family 40 (iron-regulated transporter), member 1
VLSFGDVMTGYLVWRGVRLETVSIWRGISAAMGLVGTFVFHFSSTRNITLFSTGMWSIVAQFSCLSICFWSLFLPESYYSVSMVMLIAGTCASRIGLWVFDLSATQLMQEFIPDGIRGVVGGTQQSLNALFFLLSFAIGIVVPDPQEFSIYVASGYVAVSSKRRDEEGKWWDVVEMTG